MSRAVEKRAIVEEIVTTTTIYRVGNRSFDQRDEAGAYACLVNLLEEVQGLPHGYYFASTTVADMLWERRDDLHLILSSS